jgi:hypothetical protein
MKEMRLYLYTFMYYVLLCIIMYYYVLLCIHEGIGRPINPSLSQMYSLI